MDDAPRALLGLHSSPTLFYAFVRDELGGGAIRREAYAALGRTLHGRDHPADVKDDRRSLSQAWRAVQAIDFPGSAALAVLGALLHANEALAVALLHTKRQRLAHLDRVAEAARLVANSPYFAGAHPLDFIPWHSVQDFADATSGDGSSDDPGREGPLDAHQVEQLLRNLVPDVETLARYIAQRAKALHDEPAPLGKPHAPDAPVVFIARRLNAFFKRRAGRPAHAAVAAITAAWCDQEVSEARVKELVKARGPKVQGKGNLRA